MPEYTEMIEILQSEIKRTNALACLECGKCTAVCPLSISSRRYSPRVLLTRAIRDDLDNLFQDYDLWSCLTCGKCSAYCPADIDYMELMHALRDAAGQAGFEGKCSHSGTAQSIQRIQTAGHLQSRRLDWLPSDVDVAKTGKVLYWVGCAPFYDALFADIPVNTLQAAESSIRLLNHLGITPAVLQDERCCGHDLYWNGDTENFKKLAKLNTEAIKKSGAETVLFSCAECQSALKQLYPAAGESPPVRYQHISQFLVEKLSAGELKLGPDSKQTITYHDPCRLGRLQGVYDEPRQILQAVGSLEEMRQSRKQALCCGVSGWMNCDVDSKAIQENRLRQARATGADVMAVACPKCQIHFTCTLRDEALKDCQIDIKDIATLALESMPQD